MAGSTRVRLPATTHAWFVQAGDVQRSSRPTILVTPSTATVVPLDVGVARQSGQRPLGTSGRVAGPGAGTAAPRIVVTRVPRGGPLI
jgi:hypothetical protein